MTLPELNPLLHSQLRLAIMSLLMSVEQAEFTYLKEQTKASAGNLSVQIDKLEKAGYLVVRKQFKGKRPLTTCAISASGEKAFLQYYDNLKKYFQDEND